MVKVTFRPSGKTVQARVGQNLIIAARSGRVVIQQRCGGHASCQMCKVKIVEGVVSPPSVLEQRKMSEKEMAAGYRLACQTKLQNADCIVEIPENRLKSVVATLLSRQQEENSFLARNPDADIHSEE